MPINETRPALYGNIAHPLEPGNYDLYSAAMNDSRPPDLRNASEDVRDAHSTKQAQ